MLLQTLPSRIANKQSIVDAAKKGNDSSPDIASYGATMPPGSRATSEIIDPCEATLVRADPQLKSDDVKVKQGMLMTLLSIPHVRAVLVSGFMVAMLGVGLEVVFILYSYTSIDLGGMGRSVRSDHSSYGITLSHTPYFPLKACRNRIRSCGLWHIWSINIIVLVPLHPTTLQQSPNVHHLLSMLGFEFCPDADRTSCCCTSGI